MKKILAIGSSTMDPYFFNTRVLKITDQEDDYHFTKIFSQVTGIPDYKVYAVAGAGNTWVLSSLIDKLDQIDSDTVVILAWTPIDRFDLLIDSELDHLQDEIESCVDEQFQHLSLNRTIDLDGNFVREGLRYWTSAQFMFGPKIKMKGLLSHASFLKEYYETMALAQQLLNAKGCKQIHILAMEPAHFNQKITNRWAYGLVESIIKSTGKCEPVYRVAELQGDHYDIFEKHPELLKWKSVVDWSLVPELMFEYFYKNNLPYICTDKFSNYHQVPVNQYIYTTMVAKQFGFNTTDLLDEMKQATVEHCKRYNTIYHVDDIAIQNALASPPGIEPGSTL